MSHNYFETTKIFTEGMVGRDLHNKKEKFRARAKS
jgi:hypothetical protein